MEEKVKEKQLPISYQTIIDILKGLTGLVILIYFLGFLVVSLFMMRYGYISLTIVNARYLGAGVFYAFSIAITLIIYLAAEKKNSSNEEPNYFGPFTVREWWGLAAVIFSAFMLTVFFLREPSIGDRVIFLIWFSINYFGQSIAVPQIRKYPFLSGKFVETILYEIYVLGMFSFMVYPIVPSSFVGGKPENIKLLLADSKVVESLPFKRDGQYSENLKLLDTTDKTYLLLIEIDGEDKLFELDKGLVKGVIYGVEEKPQKADTISMPAEEATIKKIDQATDNDSAAQSNKKEKLKVD